jgi:hypothetical protein
MPDALVVRKPADFLSVSGRRFGCVKALHWVRAINSEVGSHRCDLGFSHEELRTSNMEVRVTLAGDFRHPAFLQSMSNLTDPLILK